MKRKRGSIIIAILEALARGVIGAAEVFEVFVESRYGASAGELEFLLSRKRAQRAKRADEFRKFREEQQRYRNIIQYLKRQELLAEERRQGKKFFTITARGQKKLSLMKEHQSILPKIEYEKVEGEHLVIIAFDIPEREKHKRVWFREAIKYLGFRMVQRSVWVGKVKIPKEFINDLRRLKLLPFIEIFEANRKEDFEHLL